MAPRESVGNVDAYRTVGVPLEDQLDLGSCTANTQQDYRRWLCQRYPEYSAPDRKLSRLFGYWMMRALHGWTNFDSGAEMRDICVVITKYGLCLEEDWPYVVKNYRKEPPPEVIAKAATYKAGAYHRVRTVDEIISCLADPQNPYPVMLGVNLYDNFDDIDHDHSTMPMPTARNYVAGGHAMVIRGYSSERRAFHLRNWWGYDWGQHGHCWMPEEYLDDYSLSEWDAWVFHLGPPW